MLDAGRPFLQPKIADLVKITKAISKFLNFIPVRHILKDIVAILKAHIVDESNNAVQV